uniref:Uncharacterized protein n=1 Tax=Castleton Burn virus TaxID=2511032 RepID=A0A411D3C9_9VIRU|nr:hypothetical protein [Castleton Burn virus]
MNKQSTSLPIIHTSTAARQSDGTVTPHQDQMTALRSIYLRPTWGTYDEYIKLIRSKSLTPSLSRCDYERIYHTPISILKRKAPKPPKIGSSTPPSTKTVATIGVQTELSFTTLDTAESALSSEPSYITDWDMPDDQGPDWKEVDLDESTDSGNVSSSEETPSTPLSTPSSVAKIAAGSTARTIVGPAEPTSGAEETETTKAEIQEKIDRISAERELKLVQTPHAIEAANHLWTKTRGRIIDSKYQTFCASVINEYLDSCKLKDPVQRRIIMNEAMLYHVEASKKHRNPFVKDKTTIKNINQANLSDLGVHKKKRFFGLITTKARIKERHELVKECGGVSTK